MARVQFSPVPPTKQFRRRRLVARIADLQSADGSSILLAGAMCPVRPMDQDRTLRTFRFGFESRAGYQVVKWWPSGKGTSLSMRIRWVRLPSTSPIIDRRQMAIVIRPARVYCEVPNSAEEEICDHSIPKRFRYLRKRSASFVLALRPRDALNNSRPASESDLHSAHLA